MRALGPVAVTWPWALPFTFIALGRSVCSGNTEWNIFSLTNKGLSTLNFVFWLLSWLLLAFFAFSCCYILFLALWITHLPKLLEILEKRRACAFSFLKDCLSWGVRDSPDGAAVWLWHCISFPRAHLLRLSRELSARHSAAGLRFFC